MLVLISLSLTFFLTDFFYTFVYFDIPIIKVTLLGAQDICKQREGEKSTNMCDISNHFFSLSIKHDFYVRPL